MLMLLAVVVVQNSDLVLIGKAKCRKIQNCVVAFNQGIGTFGFAQIPEDQVKIVLP